MNDERNERQDTQDKRATCPMHGFEQPCPSCEMVAIEAGVYGDPYYEPPAIVYEGTLTTRAGSRPDGLAPDSGKGVEPDKLFGG